MEVRAGYKKTEAGVIPTNWETSKVGEVCGFIVPGRNKPKLFDGNIPWITTPDLAQGRVVSSSRRGLCISHAEAKAVGSKIVPAGSVLMSCAGELGVVAIVETEIVINQQLHAFVPTDRVDAKFLLNALAYRKEQIAAYGTKTAVPYLNKTACNSIPVPLPPLPEQRAIAAALSDVDALLSGLDRLIAKKRDLKQAAMQQLLTGQTRLPGFHEAWEQKALRSIVSTLITDGPHLTPKFLADGVPFLSVNNLVNNRLDLRSLRFVSKEDHLEFSKKCKPRGGDILFGKAASVGMVALIDTDMELNIWSPLALIRVGHQASAPFVFYALQTNHIRRQINLLTNSSSQGNIGMSDIGLLEVALPTYDEQIAISAVLSDMDAELAALEARRDKTRALKQGMMQELFTGKTRLAPPCSTVATLDITGNLTASGSPQHASK